MSPSARWTPRHGLTWDRNSLRIWQSVDRRVLLVTWDIDEAIALSGRAVVLSPRPARVIAEFAVELPRPRDFYVA